MAKYLKPQTPLQHQSGDYIYPITTVDQIITTNGERLNSKIVVVDTQDVNIGKPNPINADTLGGKQASEYATNDYVNQQIRKAAPYNLLDNSDFTNPVNQAGLGGVHGTRVYAIDRWNYNGSSSTEYISLNNGGGLSYALEYVIYQIMPVDILTNKYTFAIWLSDGTVACTTINGGYTSLDGTGYSVTHNNENTVYIKNNSAEIPIKYVALYEGEYTAETLPEYQPKGYGVELLECKRYFIPGDDKWNFAFVDARGFYMGFEVPCPCKMRVTPSMAGGEMQLYTSSGWVTITVPSWNKYFHEGKYSCFVGRSEISGLEIVANANYMMTGTPALCADL